MSRRAAAAAQAQVVRLKPDAAPAPEATGVLPVDGAEAPLYRLDLPAGIGGFARETIARRLLRDTAGLDVDALDIRPFAAGLGRDDWQTVVVAEAGQVAAWRAAGIAAGRAVLPDYLTLPAAAGVWCLREGPDRIVARLGPSDGFAAEPPLARLMLARALAETAPRAILPLGALTPETRAVLEASGAAWLESAGGAASLGIAVPQVMAYGERAIDFRADPRGARQRLRRAVLPWRLPVVLAACAATVWAAALWIDAVRLSGAAARFDAETRTLVREALVPEGPLLDIAVQADRAVAARRAALRADRDAQDPIELTALAGNTILAAGAELVRMRYDEALGLTLELRLADFAALDALVDALVADGLIVTLQESRIAEGARQVRVEMLVEAG